MSHRRTVRTAALGVALGGAVGASFAAGAALGSGADDPAADERRAASGADVRLTPVSYVNADLAAASCDELLDWYVERGLARVGPYGWGSPTYAWYGQGFDGTTVELDAGSMRASQPLSPLPTVPTTQRATNSATGTNVQEAGVDEPDTVKTDGTLLLRLDGGELTTYDVTGPEPERLAALDLEDADRGELLLVGDRAVVLGRTPDRLDGERTTVLVVDLDDPAAPEVVSTTSYDSALTAARQHGDTVRLVLDAGLPPLDFVEPRGRRSPDEALRHNRDAVRDSTLADWLPTVTTDDGTDPLLDCDQVALPADDVGLGTFAVVGFDPADPATTSAQGVATSSQLAYFSTDRLYLAAGPVTPDWGWPQPLCCGEPVMPDSATDDGGTTHLYAFTLSGLDTRYVASGEVDGSVPDRWAMDESGGVLRVAVGPTARTGNFTSVVTLEESDDDLVELGRVDRLGVGETMRAVRWFDGLAIVVTFRQVDPLYAVDLTDPAHPERLGQLKVPGFSEYLHPLGPHRMVGMGQSANRFGFSTGAQASLFDVHDLSDPRRLDVVRYGQGTVAGAATDPRQLTWLPQERLVLTVIERAGASRTGFVSVLRFDGGPVENRMVRVEYGSEVDDVRLVPLPGAAPDGSTRVVLVTGDGVSFFRP